MTTQEILSFVIMGVALIAFGIGIVTLVNNLRRRHMLNSVRLPEIDNEQVDLIKVFERKSIKTHKIPTVNSEEVQKIISSEEVEEDNNVLEEVIKNTEKITKKQVEDIQLPEIEDSEIKESFNNILSEMNTD